MQLTRFTDYAFRVLIHLGRHPGRLATIDEVAGAYGISRHHLMKVVGRLAACGYVETTRGKGGGMRLARRPELIGIGQVARDMEDHMHVVQCLDPAFRNCTLLPACVLKSALTQARNNFLATLDGYRLSDLIATPGRQAPAVMKRMTRAPATQ